MANKRKSPLEKELEYLIDASTIGDFSLRLNANNLPKKYISDAGVINEILENYKKNTDYNMMKYKLTSQALGVALWDMDVIGGDPVNPNNKFTWSQEFRKMLGFTDEKDFPNVLSSWSDRIHPDEKEVVLGKFANHLNDHTGRTPYNLEMRLRMKNGEYRYFHAFGDTMRDIKGVPLRVAGALEDINDNKINREMLEKEEMRFKLLLKSIDLALWDMSFITNEVWWSDELRHMFGYSDERDFPNTMNALMDRIHPDDRDVATNAFNAHVSDPSGRTPYNIKYRVMKKTGEYIWVKADGATMRTREGAPVLVVGSVEDISKNLQKDALHKEVSTFAAAVSEMKNSVDKILTDFLHLQELQEQNLRNSIESEKNAEETKTIIQTIDSIASQTNLLGINASIEAARTGAAGKGFKVVSEEIGKLAQDSVSSTKLIEDKLKNIETSAVKMTKDIKATNVLVNQQKDEIELVKQSVEKLNEMYLNLTRLIELSTD